MPVDKTHTETHSFFVLFVISLHLLLAGIIATNGHSIVFSASADRSNSLQNHSCAPVVGSPFPLPLTQFRVRKVHFLFANQDLRTGKASPYKIAGGSVNLVNPFDTTRLTHGSHTFTKVVYFLAGGGTRVLPLSILTDNTVLPEPYLAGGLTPFPEGCRFFNRNRLMRIPNDE